jgi:hypothetical protein
MTTDPQAKSNASPLQILARRVRAARERVRRNGMDRLLELEYREAAGNVQELYALRDLVDDLIDGEIIRGRDLGAPWDLLGSSRQQAQQRATRARQRQRKLTNGADDMRDSSTAVDQGTPNTERPTP